jgi:hypothetical protein
MPVTAFTSHDGRIVAAPDVAANPLAEDLNAGRNYFGMTRH